MALRKPCQMSTTLRSIDVIYKAEYAFVIRIIVLEGYFHVHIILLTFKIQNIFV